MHHESSLSDAIDILIALYNSYIHTLRAYILRKCFVIEELVWVLEISGNPSTINLKQYANSLNNKAHCRMISLFLEANQKMLPHQFTKFQALPLSTISTTLFVKSTQINQGIG